jgi:hypothetical protein
MRVVRMMSRYCRADITDLLSAAYIHLLTAAKSDRLPATFGRQHYCPVSQYSSREDRSRNRGPLLVQLRFAFASTALYHQGSSLNAAKKEAGLSRGPGIPQEARRRLLPLGLYRAVHGQQPPAHLRQGKLLAMTRD